MRPSPAMATRPSSLAQHALQQLRLAPLQQARRARQQHRVDGRRARQRQRQRDQPEHGAPEQQRQPGQEQEGRGRAAG